MTDPPDDSVLLEALPAKPPARRWRASSPLGPLFVPELLRLSRSRGPFILRVLFGVAMLGGLLLAVAQWCMRTGQSFAEALTEGVRAEIAEQAAVAAGLTTAVLFAQAFALWLVTPGYILAMLPQERAVRVLELIEAAGVPVGQALWSKAAARGVVLASLVLLGVPIIAGV